MISAVIDIGSNTTRLLIVDRTQCGQYAIRKDITRITHLSQGKTNAPALVPEACERTLSVLADYKKIIDAHSVDEAFAFTTSPLREVSNPELFITAFKARIGIDLFLLSGQQEAAAIYRGVQCGSCVELDDAVVIDVGGGSSEVIYMSGETGIVLCSMPLGFLSLAEAFNVHDTVSKAAIDDLCATIDQRLCLDFPGKAGVCYGTGGSLWQLGALIAAGRTPLAVSLHEMYIDRGEITSVVDALCRLSHEERLLTFAALDPDRADSVIAGGFIIERLLHRLGSAGIKISLSDIRYGALELFCAGKLTG